MEALEDSVADQDYSSEPETILTQRIEQEVEDLSESSDDQPAEDSDRMPEDDGLSNMDIHRDTITRGEQLQTETEGDISITMEVDPMASNEQPQKGHRTDIENQSNQMQSKIKGSLSGSWMNSPIPSLLFPLWQNES